MNVLKRIVFAIAAITVIAVLGLTEESSSSSTNHANPMKVNYVQYDRISPNMYAAGN
ncbi:hypothetical protein [Paenibacillus thalictri]|uniref:hypothetical protein n=1 Tax=Paenibacillus thalictri TaxID=2527873 RepID=UPI0013EF5A2D|nr:hypothetical protein [Paenibacillus thalictri]